MIGGPFSAESRARLLDEHRRAVQALSEAAGAWEARSTMVGTQEEGAAARRLLDALPEILELEQEYFEQLPRIAMSSCPFCRKPLYRSFDPYGLEGFWWGVDADPEEPPACPHFCVLRGALSFAGRPPRAGDFEVYCGPGVPYVIPRLLEHPGMVAVLHALEMANGYRAYPIAYFAEHPPPPEQLTSEWARPWFAYTTQLGEPGWRLAGDAWDFELAPWLERGNLQWCDPKSGEQAPTRDAARSCPYLDLSGERRPLVVRGARIWTAGDALLAI